MKKLSVFFFALTVMIGVSNVMAQSSSFSGKWIIDQEEKPGVISHLTITGDGNCYEISRTKAPEEKWAAMLDSESRKMYSVLGGLLVYLVHDPATDRLTAYKAKNDKKLLELKRN